MNKIIWIINVEDIRGEELDVDWNLILTWAKIISDESEFEITPAGVNMLFAKAQKVAEEDLATLFIPSILLLILILTLGLQDWKISSITLVSLFFHSGPPKSPNIETSSSFNEEKKFLQL